jgi:hypothetical protein
MKLQAFFPGIENARAFSDLQKPMVFDRFFSTGGRKKADAEAGI